MGIVFVALSLILESYINAIVFTVLSTIGAFALWEASSILIVDNPEVRVTKLIAINWINHTEIEFSLLKEDENQTE